MRLNHESQHYSYFQWSYCKFYINMLRKLQNLLSSHVGGCLLQEKWIYSHCKHFWIGTISINLSLCPVHTHTHYFFNNKFRSVLILIKTKFNFVIHYGDFKYSSSNHLCDRTSFLPRKHMNAKKANKERNYFTSRVFRIIVMF